MTNKRKIRIDRLIIVILSSILILGLISLGIYELIELIKDNKSSNTNIKPSNQTETLKDVKCELIDYTVYKDDTDSFDFNFVICEIKFTGKETVSFNLNDLQTSEKIVLANVNEYLDTLNKNGYDITKLNIDSVVTSKDPEIKCHIFVPYKTNSNELKIYNSNDPSTSINVDLTKNQRYISSLKFNSNGQEIEVENANIYVSNCSISTMMLHNDQEYNVGSTNKVFTFKIYVNEIEDDVSIVDAYFIKDDDISEEEHHCKDESYSSVKVENIIGKTLKVGENGALFFEMYAPEQEPDYSGLLMIKFSNSNKWIKVSTNLE